MAERILGADLITFKPETSDDESKVKPSKKKTKKEKKPVGFRKGGKKSGLPEGKKVVKGSRPGGKNVMRKRSRAERMKLGKMRALIVERNRLILANKTHGDITLEREVFGGPDGVLESLAKLKKKKKEKLVATKEERRPKIAGNEDEEDEESDEDMPEAAAASGSEESGIDEQEDEEDESDEEDEAGGESSEEEGEDEEEKKTKGPVWVDEDDEVTRIKDVAATYRKGKHTRLDNNEASYKKFMEKRFSSVYGSTPKWAKVPSAEEKEADDPMLMKTGVYLKGSHGSLSKGSLNLKPCQDLNGKKGLEGFNLVNVQFHPWSQVAMVAGETGTVSLYQVDGKENPKLQSVRFEYDPLRAVQFSHDGNEIIVGPGRFAKSFFVHDMMSGDTKRVLWPKGLPDPNWAVMAICPKGRYIVGRGMKLNEINFMTGRTKEYIGTVHLSDDIRALAFSPDGDHLLAVGDGGFIHVIDAASRRCVSRLTDLGSLRSTAVAFSPDSEVLAVGNSSGVVNVYESKTVVGGTTSDPEPVKQVMNLVTSVSTLKFNHSSEILAMASRERDNTCRLWDVKGRRTFDNFPLLNAKYKKVTAMDFSLHSGFLAMTNMSGRALLYRLPFFKDY